MSGLGFFLMPFSPFMFEKDHFNSVQHFLPFLADTGGDRHFPDMEILSCCFSVLSLALSFPVSQRENPTTPRRVWEGEEEPGFSAGDKALMPVRLV